MAMRRSGDVDMSDKQKKFQPNVGFVVAVHQNVIGIRSVAKALDIYPEKLGEALEMAGYQLVVDPFDLSADATKVIRLQERKATEGLRVVEQQSEDDEPNESE